MGIVSCTDSWFDTSSKTELNSGSFYKNQVQATYALTGCYDQYQRTVSEGAWPGIFIAAEMGSDDAFGGGSQQMVAIVLIRWMQRYQRIRRIRLKRRGQLIMMLFTMTTS